ncbi:alkaline phosphatase family protein [Nesterenkonia muleiensis]|uniref:alkaline phosphatase family protein n=1 Tax=Nesterenkonia muleiensis TaxID=2282648 RepID=UPI000E723F21|nr:nucleotide pyrophosphatase/phosphodiesterase family protein [Nesterenkonia muleiensis]
MGPLPAPPNSQAHLQHVLTSAASALGLEGFTNRLRLPEAEIAVVILADGLGDKQLAAHTGHARFLASAWRSTAAAQVLDSGAPTTTASSLASLGTGLAAGQHGLVGYDVLSPELSRVVNMLGQWDSDVAPRQWQPHRTVFESAEHGGAKVLTCSRPKFRSSPLTQAVLRGGQFSGADTIERRFDAAADWIGAHRPATGTLHRGRPAPVLVYLYVDELDKTGHRTGVGSARWLQMLETLDSAARRLCRGLTESYGSLARVVLTADHGMINLAQEQRIDISGRPDLLAGVAHTGGEPRFLHLYTEAAGQAKDVAERWHQAYGDQAWVLTREEAVAEGWFGTVEDRVLPRIGDVLVAAQADIAFFHTERTGKDVLKMVGQHGSLTEAERRVPLLQLA